jgi:hypothetical protein
VKRNSPHSLFVGPVTGLQSHIHLNVNVLPVAPIRPRKHLLAIGTFMGGGAGCQVLNNGSNTTLEGQFVDARRLLEIVFEEGSRPSLRWLRDQQVRRAIPFVKLGRLVFFDPVQVRAALNRQSSAR